MHREYAYTADPFMNRTYTCMQKFHTSKKWYKDVDWEEGRWTNLEYKEEEEQELDWGEERQTIKEYKGGAEYLLMHCSKWKSKGKIGLKRGVKLQDTCWKRRMLNMFLWWVLLKPAKHLQLRARTTKKSLKNTCKNKK